KAADIVRLGAVIGLIEREHQPSACIKTKRFFRFENGHVLLAKLWRDRPAVALAVVQGQLWRESLLRKIGSARIPRHHDGLSLASGRSGLNAESRQNKISIAVSTGAIGGEACVGKHFQPESCYFARWNNRFSRIDVRQNILAADEERIVGLLGELGPFR